MATAHAAIPFIGRVRSGLDAELDEVVRMKLRERRLARGISPYARPSAAPEAKPKPIKVSADSRPNAVAGAICNEVRRSAAGGRDKLPTVMATGPVAVNQACKALAIARKYLSADAESIELTLVPYFERDCNRVTLELQRGGTNTTAIEAEEPPLTAKETTDASKLAGAIAKKLREARSGGAAVRIGCLAKGALAVLIATKAVDLARDFLCHDGIEPRVALSLRDMQDPELQAMSTFVHFSISSM